MCGVLLRRRGTMLEYGLSPETEDGHVGFTLTKLFIVSKNF